MKSSLLVAAAATSCSCARAFVPAAGPPRPSVARHGLLDGVKSAFGAEGMGELDGDRETPIDRWMGWNAKAETSAKAAMGSQQPAGFVDSMDASNYVATSLAKPMGIIFEENDAEFGGIFALEVSEGSSAASDGTVRPGDQLVSVGGTKVSGMQFEEALGTIVDSTEELTKLTFFRGPAKFLYGPAGASKEWLDDFIKGAEVEVEVEAEA